MRIDRAILFAFAKDWSDAHMHSGGASGVERIHRKYNLTQSLRQSQTYQYRAVHVASSPG
jgi:hypothetical protein